MFVREKLVESDEALLALLDFAIIIHKHYYDNPYHSFHHAVDVMFVSWYFLKELRVQEQACLCDTEVCALLVAALGHDAKHPGTNNLFQVTCVL